MTARICVRARGPLAVEGDFELVGADGQRLDTGDKKRVLLCRCGASGSKPFCDGSHYRTSFEAPPPEEPQT
jgi:CDGSH-type Zn-finger protein